MIIGEIEFMNEFKPVHKRFHTQREGVQNTLWR